MNKIKLKKKDNSTKLVRGISQNDKQILVLWSLKFILIDFFFFTGSNYNWHVELIL